MTAAWGGAPEKKPYLCRPGDPCGHCDLCVDIPATIEAFDGVESANGHHPYRATRLADVQPEEVDWIWPGKLPRRKLVTLFGDPDVGKSTLSIDWTSRVTTGQPMPGEACALIPPSGVVIMSAEDGLADTIRPRLDAAGADTTRVHHLDAVARYDDDGNATWAPPSIPGDVDVLEGLIADTGAVLVIVDVLNAYLAGSHKVTADQDVRRALAPLAEIADRTGACIVLIGHIPKGQRRGGDRIAATGGAMGVVGAARVGMIAAVDPGDDTEQRRILARAKGNLAPPWPSFAYTLVSDGGCARVEWLGEVDITGDQLLAGRDNDEERSELQAACDWLEAVLADGPRRRSELITEARSEGIAERTFKRAGQRLKVHSEQDEHMQGKPATWSLPGYGPRVMGQTPLAHNPQSPDQGKQAELGGYGPGDNVWPITPPKPLICLRCGGPPDHPATLHQPYPGDPDKRF